MLPLQVEIVCCAYYHLRAQQIFMLQTVDVAFTFCIVKICYAQQTISTCDGNIDARQVARKCCPYYWAFTSSRRLRICKTISVFYSILYGHCFPLFIVLSLCICLLFCKFCVFYRNKSRKNTSCGTCLKAAFGKVLKCAYFLKSTGSKIVVGPEIFHWCSTQQIHSFGVNITTYFRQEHQNLLSNCSFNPLSSLLSSSATSRTRSGSKR